MDLVSPVACVVATNRIALALEVLAAVVVAVVVSVEARAFVTLRHSAYASAFGLGFFAILPARRQSCFR